MFFKKKVLTSISQRYSLLIEPGNKGFPKRNNKDAIFQVAPLSVNLFRVKYEKRAFWMDRRMSYELSLLE